MKNTSEQLFLDNQLCFPLYAASRLTTKIYAPYLQVLDLTYPQYLVMLVLWEHKTQNVNQIGKRLFLESNTLTPLLKRLEQKALITRRRSTLDERSVELRLTEKGEKLKEKAQLIPQNILNFFQDDEWNELDFDLKNFQTALIKLSKRLHQKLQKTNL